MKQAADNKTIDLVTASSRQGRYIARKAEQGLKRRTLWISDRDLDAGAAAARAGLPMQIPADVDPVSWVHGYRLASEAQA